VVVGVVASLLARWLGGLTRRLLNRTKLEATVADFLSLGVRVSVWVLSVPVALAVFGVDATSLAALIGAAGLAVGLSLQGSLSNIAASVVLAMIRPIRVGDIVEVASADIGIVKQVGMFYSVVDTFNRVRVYVPNSEVLGSRIENYTVNGVRRVDVPVGVAYGTDLGRAREVLRRAAEEGVPTRDTENEPRVLLTGFGASSIDFEVQVYGPAREFLDVRHEVVLAIDLACKEHGITIAFPQRDLHFAGPLTIRREDGEGGGGG
jgi:small conductance mechanosensitive channel